MNPYYIFIIFAISILFVSNGYALLSDTQKIVGKANILYEEQGEKGNSTYSWYQRYSWGGGDTAYIYDVVLEVTNLDEEYQNSLEISFDVDGDFLVEEAGNCNVWQVDTVTYSGKTITLHFKEGFSYLALGATETYYLHLRFSEPVDVNITNLAINGKLATYIASEQS